MRPEATVISTRSTAVGPSTERAERTSDVMQIIRAGPMPRPIRSATRSSYAPSRTSKQAPRLRTITAAIISPMSSRGVAANATSVGRNEPMRARRHAPKADEPVPPPHLVVLDGTRAVGLMRTRRRSRDLPHPRWTHAFSSSARMFSLRDRSRWQASFQYSRRFAKLYSVVSNSTNKPPRLIARDPIGTYQVRYLNLMS